MDDQLIKNFCLGGCLLCRASRSTSFIFSKLLF